MKKTDNINFVIGQGKQFDLSNIKTNGNVTVFYNKDGSKRIKIDKKGGNGQKTND